jgi:5-methylcytosine-specific restriction enzyme A
MKPGCRALVTGRYCAEHEPKRTNVFKATHTQGWRAYSKAFLARHPVCADPYGRHRGQFVAASVTDHIQAHKGDMELFWAHENHQALCNECNAFKCVKLEGGFGNLAIK